MHSSRILRAAGQRVFIAGEGLVPVTRKRNVTLDGMGGAAIQAALQQAQLEPSAVGALFVGNMMSGMLSSQQHLGPLLANAAGLTVEAATAEACCGSGGAALRWGVMAVLSGLVETVVVCGVEHMTHAHRDVVTKSLATASHWETEGGQGATFVSLNGQLMQAYMDRYNVSHDDFAPWALTAHANAQTADHAVFRGKSLDFKTYSEADTITGPVKLFDASPTCDGAAAVVLTSNIDLARQADGRLVEILSSAAAVDTLPIAKRENALHLRAVEQSAKKCIESAGLRHEDIDIFEAHDAYTVMACLSFENAGFIKPGEGIAYAKEGHISLTGQLPFATFGGLKARGHPVGATGVYQACEMTRQLRGTAGRNQVPRAQVALLQNIGGAAASVFAHIVGRT